MSQPPMFRPVGMTAARPKKRTMNSPYRPVSGKCQTCGAIPSKDKVITVHLVAVRWAAGFMVCLYCYERLTQGISPALRTRLEKYVAASRLNGLDKGSGHDKAR
jgi:hypothetical protein